MGQKEKQISQPSLLHGAVAENATLQVKTAYVYVAAVDLDY